MQDAHEETKNLEGNSYLTDTLEGLALSDGHAACTSHDQTAGKERTGVLHHTTCTNYHVHRRLNMLDRLRANQGERFTSDFVWQDEL